MSYMVSICKFTINYKKPFILLFFSSDELSFKSKWPNFTQASEHWHPSLSIPIGLSNWSSIWPWKMLYDFIMKVPVSKSKNILEFSRERDEQEAESITLS